MDASNFGLFVPFTLVGALGASLAVWWRFHPITAASWIERVLNSN